MYHRIYLGKKGSLAAEYCKLKNRFDWYACQSRKGENMKNIFIEGIQGMGKSTLLQKIADQNLGYRICREGDYSPVELAWCAWTKEEEYRRICERYSALREEIERNTVKEEDHYIVCYTKILTDIPGFHKDLEQYEIYNKRRTLEDFEEIILSRYRRFRGSGYIFECAFLQNIVEELILFWQLDDEEILFFYRGLYQEVEQEKFVLLYLDSDRIEDNIKVIQKERSDEAGNALWYSLMMEYLCASPCGKAHGWREFDDLIAHLEHRRQVEKRILCEIVGERASVLSAKQWRIDEIINLIK